MDKISTFTTIIQNKKVSLQCSDSLSEQAGFLLELLEDEQEQTNILQNNFKIQIGWSIYFIEECNGEYKILVPDYKKDPFTNKSSDISLPILIQLQQNHILRRADRDGQAISFKDTLVVLKDALEADFVYLERKEKCEEGDSGWYLGLIKDDKKGNRKVDDYKRIYVYELLQCKPQLLQLLALPTGSFAVIEGEDIVEVVDENNNKIL
jgi:hypothetical protein